MEYNNKHAVLSSSVSNHAIWRNPCPFTTMLLISWLIVICHESKLRRILPVWSCCWQGSWTSRQIHWHICTNYQTSQINWGPHAFLTWGQSKKLNFNLRWVLKRFPSNFRTKKNPEARFLVRYLLPTCSSSCNETNDSITVFIKDKDITTINAVVHDRRTYADRYKF